MSTPDSSHIDAAVVTAQAVMPPVQAHTAPSAEHRLERFSILWLLAANFFTLGLFGNVWLNLMHDKMPKNRPNDPSAAKAIGFLFIPLFNMVWLFITYSRLMNRINEQRQLRGMSRSAPRGLAIASCIVVVVSIVSYQAARLIIALDGGREVQVLPALILASLPALFHLILLFPLVLIRTQCSVNGLVNLTGAEPTIPAPPHQVELAENRAQAEYRRVWGWLMLLFCSSFAVLLVFLYVAGIMELTHFRSETRNTTWITMLAFWCIASVAAIAFYATAVFFFQRAASARRRITKVGEQRSRWEGGLQRAEFDRKGRGFYGPALLQAVGAMALLLGIAVGGWTLFVPATPATAVAESEQTEDPPLGSVEYHRQRVEESRERLSDHSRAQESALRPRTNPPNPTNRPKRPFTPKTPAGPKRRTRTAPLALPDEPLDPPPAPPSLKKGERYLRDLKPSQVRTHPIIKYDRTFSLGGVKYEHGLSLTLNFRPPKSFATYELENAYARLRGAAGVADNRIHGAKSPLTLRVLADDVEVWHSKPMQHSGEWDSFDVDLTGISRLKLELEAAGNIDGGHGVWLDPVLVE